MQINSRIKSLFIITKKNYLPKSELNFEHMKV